MSDTAAHKLFAFDTVFDGDRVIEPRRAKRVFTPVEVEAARAERGDFTHAVEASCVAPPNEGDGMEAGAELASLLDEVTVIDQTTTGELAA